MGLEYATGWLLRRLTGRCPWDYADSGRRTLSGLVRPDYAPFWYAAGLLFEPLRDAVKVAQKSNHLRDPGLCDNGPASRERTHPRVCLPCTTCDGDGPETKVTDRTGPRRQR